MKGKDVIEVDDVVIGIDDEDPGVDVAGDRDRLLGKTYGAVSRLLNDTFCSSTGNRVTYGISGEVMPGVSACPGERDEWLLVAAPDSPPEDVLSPIV